MEICYCWRIAACWLARIVAPWPYRIYVRNYILYTNPYAKMKWIARWPDYDWVQHSLITSWPRHRDLVLLYLLLRISRDSKATFSRRSLMKTTTDPALLLVVLLLVSSSTKDQQEWWSRAKKKVTRQKGPERFQLYLLTQRFGAAGGHRLNLHTGLRHITHLVLVWCQIDFDRRDVSTSQSIQDVSFHSL